MLTRFGQTVCQIIVIMRKWPKKKKTAAEIANKLRGDFGGYQTAGSYEIGRRKLAADYRTIAFAHPADTYIHMFLNGKLFHSSFIADTNQSLYLPAM